MYFMSKSKNITAINAKLTSKDIVPQKMAKTALIGRWFFISTLEVNPMTYTVERRIQIKLQKLKEKYHIAKFFYKIRCGKHDKGLYSRDVFLY